MTDYPLEQSALLLPKAISNALAGLELSVDQAGLTLKRSSDLCLLGAGIRDTYIVFLAAFVRLFLFVLFW